MRVRHEAKTFINLIVSILCFLRYWWNPLRADLIASGVTVLPSSLVRQHMCTELARYQKPHAILARAMNLFGNQITAFLGVCGLGMSVGSFFHGDRPLLVIAGILMGVPLVFWTILWVGITFYLKRYPNYSEHHKAFAAMWEFRSIDLEQGFTPPRHIEDRMLKAAEIPGTTFERAQLYTDPIVFACRTLPFGIHVWRVPIGAYHTGNPTLDSL